MPGLIKRTFMVAPRPLSVTAKLFESTSRTFVMVSPKSTFDILHDKVSAQGFSAIEDKFANKGTVQETLGKVRRKVGDAVKDLGNSMRK